MQGDKADSDPLAAFFGALALNPTAPFARPSELEQPGFEGALPSQPLLSDADFLQWTQQPVRLSFSCSFLFFERLLCCVRFPATC